MATSPSRRDNHHGKKPVAEGRLAGITFDTLLSLARRRHGASAAICDDNRTVSFDELDARVARLATLLAQMGARPGQTLAILAPLGLETCVSLLAGLRAGLSPLPIPVDIPQDALTRLLEQSATEIAIGVDAFAGLSPLLMLRDAALRVFSLRCIAGFGAAIPAGVIALDPHLTAGPAGPPPALVGGVRSLRLVDPQTWQMREVSVSEDQVLEAGLAVVQALALDAPARLVSTLLGADLASLASGLAASLMTGAIYQPLGLFSNTALQTALAGETPVHLVVPAAVADAFLNHPLTSAPHLQTLVVAHDRESGPQMPLLNAGSAPHAIVDVQDLEAEGFRATRRTR